jgi:hypothetical protein
MTPAPIERLRRATACRVRGPWRRDGRDAGQTTAEYALVILGAAAIATLLIVWAKGSGAISDLFDEVVSKIL